MAVFTSLFLFFGVVLVTFGRGGTEESSVDVNGSVTKAVHWMLAQRQEDYSWGPFTPRAVVALFLSKEVVPLPKDEVNLMTKQLSILLSLELGKDLTTKTMGLSRLALYVNALYATCQDPRNFHGLDLIRILRIRTDAVLANSSDFNLPVVFLPLCLAGETKFHDVRTLTTIYQNHRNKTDLQALELLALTCITRQDGFVSSKQYLDSLLAGFRHSVDFARADSYKLALALQALNAASGSPVDVTPLVQKQSPDGSFGSLLGTYYALPALLGKSVLSLTGMHCSNDTSIDGFVASPLAESGSPRMYYSLWVGEGDNKDSHTLTMTMLPNKTLFDIMQMAQARNPNFRFSYDKTSRGKLVYSLAGIPNEVERELYWTLHLTKDGPSGPSPRRSMQKITKGVDHIFPAAEDHYIFWFRRDASR